MRLRALELDEFRSFRKLQLRVDPAGFRAIGSNASGKSTLLEAIAMLATTRSPRTSVEREIPNWASGVELGVPPYVRIHGVFERADGLHQIEIGVSAGDQGTGALRKQIRLDGRPIRALEAVGQLKTVLFSPEDVDLVAGAPGNRRRYLDITFSQANQSYLRTLSRFGRVLEQRNSLLRSFARDRIGPDSTRPAQELAYWDAELTATAADVLALRIGGIAALSASARDHFEELTGTDSLALTYVSRRTLLPEAPEPGTSWRSPSQFLRQEVAAAFAAAMAESRGEELRRGVTALGPHRDDMMVSAGGIDLGRFGSRGQQRLAVIAIKLAELDLLEEAAEEPPVLLLDDVLSELDASHRARLISTLSSREAQTFVTAADRLDLDMPGLSDLPFLKIEAGSILPNDQA